MAARRRIYDDPYANTGQVASPAGDYSAGDYSTYSGAGGYQPSYPETPQPASPAPPVAPPIDLPGSTQNWGNYNPYYQDPNSPGYVPPSSSNPNWLAGAYDPTKLGTSKSAKYQLGSTFQNFDPSKGVTSDVLGALNKLGLANFYGSGDKLGWNNITQAGQQAGMEGDFSGDFIQGYNSGNPLWTYDFAQPAGGGGGSVPPQLQSAMNVLGMPGGASGGSASGSSSSSSSGGGGGYDIKAILGQLLGSGAGSLNDKIINSRLDQVRGTLNRQRKSTLANDRAIMADRGLLGSGAESSALTKLDTDLGGQFSDAAAGIYGDEAAASDQRLIQALQIAAGLTADEAKNAIAQYAAETGRIGVGNDFTLGQGRLNLDSILGQGQLALGNFTAQNNANLGFGRLGLDSQLGAYGVQNQQTQNWLALLQILANGAGTSANGHV